MHPHGSMQQLPESSDKLGSSVKNDDLGHTMQTQDASKVQLNILLSSVVGVHWGEMSILGEPIHDHPYEIILVGRERQTHDEIQANVFPFPDMNI
jgi:hypothetical protein